MEDSEKSVSSNGEKILESEVGCVLEVTEEMLRSCRKRSVLKRKKPGGCDFVLENNDSDAVESSECSKQDNTRRERRVTFNGELEFKLPDGSKEIAELMMDDSGSQLETRDDQNEKEEEVFDDILSREMDVSHGRLDCRSNSLEESGVGGENDEELARMETRNLGEDEGNGDNNERKNETGSQVRGGEELRENKDTRKNDALDKENGHIWMNDAIDKENGDTRMNDALDKENGDTGMNDALDKENGDTGMNDAIDKENGDTRMNDALDKENGDTGMNDALDQNLAEGNRRSDLRKKPEKKKEIKTVVVQKNQNVAVDTGKNEERKKDEIQKKDNANRRFTVEADMLISPDRMSRNVKLNSGAENTGESERNSKTQSEKSTSENVAQLRETAGRNKKYDVGNERKRKARRKRKRNKKKTSNAVARNIDVSILNKNHAQNPADQGGDDASLENGIASDPEDGPRKRKTNLRSKKRKSPEPDNNDKENNDDRKQDENINDCVDIDDKNSISEAREQDENEDEHDENERKQTKVNDGTENKERKTNLRSKKGKSLEPEIDENPEPFNDNGIQDVNENNEDKKTEQTSESKEAEVKMEKKVTRRSKKTKSLQPEIEEMVDLNKSKDGVVEVESEESHEEIRNKGQVEKKTKAAKKKSDTVVVNSAARKTKSNKGKKRKAVVDDDQRNEEVALNMENKDQEMKDGTDDGEDKEDNARKSNKRGRKRVLVETEENEVKAMNKNEDDNEMVESAVVKGLVDGEDTESCERQTRASKGRKRELPEENGMKGKEYEGKRSEDGRSNIENNEEKDEEKR